MKRSVPARSVPSKSKPTPTVLEIVAKPKAKKKAKAVATLTTGEKKLNGGLQKWLAERRAAPKKPAQAKAKAPKPASLGEASASLIDESAAKLVPAPELVAFLSAAAAVAAVDNPFETDAGEVLTREQYEEREAAEDAAAEAAQQKVLPLCSECERWTVNGQGHSQECSLSNGSVACQ